MTMIRTILRKLPATTRFTIHKRIQYDSSEDAYDDGYDDIYDDGDYDYDRYDNDEDYAEGVDDAMAEIDW